MSTSRPPRHLRRALRHPYLQYGEGFRSRREADRDGRQPGREGIRALQYKQIVREADLGEAPRSGRIAGAGLDVYEREPALTPGLAELPNVVLTPHIGSGSIETRTRMAVMAAENLTAALAGRRPPNPINPELLGS